MRISFVIRPKKIPMCTIALNLIADKFRDSTKNSSDRHYHLCNWQLFRKNCHLLLVVISIDIFSCCLLFVVTRPAGTRDRLLLKSVPLPHCILVQNVHVIIIPAGTIARSSRFGPESTRGPIIATRHPASQAQGKRSPHDLPDLLSGRGLTYEGPYLKNPLVSLVTIISHS
jgi:hypothetical protein